MSTTILPFYFPAVANGEQEILLLIYKKKKIEVLKVLDKKARKIIRND